MGLTHFTDALEREGLTLEYEPPLEERGAGAEVAAVVVSILSNGAYDAIKAGIRKFRERGGRGDIEVDGKPRD